MIIVSPRTLRPLKQEDSAPPGGKEEDRAVKERILLFCLSFLLHLSLPPLALFTSSLLARSDHRFVISDKGRSEIPHRGGFSSLYPVSRICSRSFLPLPRSRGFALRRGIVKFVPPGTPRRKVRCERNGVGKRGRKPEREKEREDGERERERASVVNRRKR